jgi:hypothetical protein
MLARVARALPIALLVALAAFAIYVWGWRGGSDEASAEEKERAKARLWAQVLAVTGDDGIVRGLERTEPFLWTAVIDKPGGTICFLMHVDPARDDQPGFEHGTVAEIPCALAEF